MSLFKSKKVASEPPRRRSSQPQPERAPLASSQLFKRNRTLTGSSSGRFGSAGEQQADIMSPRAAAHELEAKKRQLSRMLGGVILGVILLAVLLWQLIVGVSVYGGDGVAIGDDAKYSRTIKDYLVRQPLQRLRLTLDQSALTAYVSSSHPEVESVKLSQPNGPASSRFELTMRKPVARWRVSNADRYVDRGGVSFAANYYDNPSIQIVDSSGIEPGSGASVASGRFLGFVGNVVRLSESLGYKPTGVTIPPASTRQIEVTYADFEYPVKYTIDRRAGEQVEDMDRAVGYLSSKDARPEYLDVRVSGRAFYR